MLCLLHLQCSVSTVNNRRKFSSWQQVLCYRYQYQYFACNYKYQYPKNVLKYNSSTSTKYNKTAGHSFQRWFSHSPIYDVMSLLLLLLFTVRCNCCFCSPTHSGLQPSSSDEQYFKICVSKLKLKRVLVLKTED